MCGRGKVRAGTRDFDMKLQIEHLSWCEHGVCHPALPPAVPPLLLHWWFGVTIVFWKSMQPLSQLLAPSVPKLASLVICHPLPIIQLLSLSPNPPNLDVKEHIQIDYICLLNDPLLNGLQIKFYPVVMTLPWSWWSTNPAVSHPGCYCSFSFKQSLNKKKSRANLSSWFCHPAPLCTCQHQFLRCWEPAVLLGQWVRGYSFLKWKPSSFGVKMPF